MTTMRLGAFITLHMERILAEWEAFAATIVPPALTMDSKALRNHAKLMLEAVVVDLANEQTGDAQLRKSHGLGRLIAGESSAETHAVARLFSGFTVEQLIAEYRALRASVLRLWAGNSATGLYTDPMDVMRFNEAIDQAVAESVSRYTNTVSTSQHLFLAILGHDLRNPLATTIMASRLIMEGGQVDSRVSTAAARIHVAGQRMNKLVNDLLDYSRTNLGSKLPILPKSANLEALCREALTEQEIAHPECCFQLVAEGDFDGQWDDNRIAQVLSNLIGNAVQYSTAGAPIILRLHSEVEQIVLCVENMGKAIPDDKLGTIFEPLVRLAADGQSQSNSNGLGIGLYIAREIVRAHGGTITVTSREASGTVFAVTLPRQSQGSVPQQWGVPA